MQLARSNQTNRLDGLTLGLLGLGVVGAVVGFFLAMGSPPDQSQG